MSANRTHALTPAANVIVSIRPHTKGTSYSGVTGHLYHKGIKERKTQQNERNKINTTRPVAQHGNKWLITSTVERNEKESTKKKRKIYTKGHTMIYNLANTATHKAPDLHWPDFRQRNAY